MTEAYELHRKGHFKKGFKAAKKAMTKFQKDGLTARALEARRVMADCAINMRDLKTAETLYEDLVRDSRVQQIPFFEAAGSWGLGEVASHRMDYRSASATVERGLSVAERIADRWFTAWNAFGLGKAYRGLGRTADARSHLGRALDIARAEGWTNLVLWVERVLSEIGGDTPVSDAGPDRLWLCPMCGSKLNRDQVQLLLEKNITSCEYCGTTIG